MSHPPSPCHAETWRYPGKAAVSEEVRRTFSRTSNPLSAARTKLEGVFTNSQNGTGDLALWWEVARNRRLGRRNCNHVVAARKTRANLGHANFQSWETSSIPGACVPRAAADSPVVQADIRLVCGALTAQPVEIRASATDEKPALASAGLTNQVESLRPYPPSSLMKSSGDLDDSRAVCPISRTSAC